jgi:hypothetical protein
MELQDRTDDWLADRRKELLTSISRLNKEAKELAAEVDLIEIEFNQRFTDRNSTGTQTDKWSITQVVDDYYPEIQDRDDFDAYLIATRKLHLMQKRLSVTSIREELDLLLQEKQHWLEELNYNNWNEETCTKCLEHILDRRINEQVTTDEELTLLQKEHEHRLTVLRAIGTWEAVTMNILDDFYRIPGVTIREKTKISQRKR